MTSLIKKPKGKFDQDLLTGVAYKISCKDCEKVYIGQEHNIACKLIMILILTMLRLWTAVLSGHADCF